MHYLKRLLSKNKQAQRSMSKKIYFGNLLVSVAVLGCIVVYFLQVNTIVYKGYAIRDAENQIKQLNDEYKQLELDVINLQSIQSITERAQSLGFVPTGSSEYVQITASNFAQR